MSRQPPTMHAVMPSAAATPVPEGVASSADAASNGGSRPGIEALKVFADCLPSELLQELQTQLPISRFAQWHDEGLPFYRTTFWYPRGRQPAHLLEQVIEGLALAVQPTPDVIGTEWWFSVVRTNAAPLWLLPCHFDRSDLDEREPSRIRHPEWASVLFLNDVPYGELMITEQVIGVDAEPFPYQARQARFVMPDVNRYAVFPGQLFHGVAGRMWRPREPEVLRVSLAVNWWTERPKAAYLRDSAEAPSVWELDPWPAHIGD